MQTMSFPYCKKQHSLLSLLPPCIKYKNVLTLKFKFKPRMIASLTEQKKEQFSNIIFNHNDSTALDLLEQVQRQEDIITLKKIYDQKIAFECAYTPFKPPKQPNTHQQNIEHERAAIPSIIGTFCFCFYPEDNKDLFDITNQIFLKRFFAVFMFWRKNFLKIGGGIADLYGPVWLILTYIALVGFMANITVYLNDQISFSFNEDMYSTVLGIVLLFSIAQILFYPAIIGCLGGFITTQEAACLLGYSVVLYYIPTTLCMFTSLAWYVTCLFGQGIIRSIFLYRNFSTRIESKTYILLMVFILVQFFYAYILLQVVFYKFSGYTYSDGINQITAKATVLQPEARLIPVHMTQRTFQY